MAPAADMKSERQVVQAAPAAKARNRTWLAPWLLTGAVIGLLVAVGIGAGVVRTWGGNRVPRPDGHLVVEKEKADDLPTVTEQEPEPEPVVAGQFVKRDVVFVNNMQTDLHLFWWDAGASKEVEMGALAPGQRFASTTYSDHIWTFRQGTRLVRSVAITPKSERIVYARQDRSGMDEYYRRTGVKWNNIWPRPPVAYHMYGTDTIGDVDPVVVPYAHWHSTNDDLSKLGNDVCGSCSRAASDLGAAQENVTIQVETVSTSPRVVRISNFMSSDECDEFIKTAKDNGGFQRSVTTDAGVVHPSRTSSNIWLDTAVTPLFEHVSRRMFAIMKIPYSVARARKISESFQLLHYGPAQQYMSHTDWFDVDTEDNAHYLSVLKGYNRFATFFLYLNDVDEGGETAFPLAKGFEYDGGVDEGCTKGLRVKARAGDAIVFYSMLPDGNLDPQSLHAGCPVLKGEKYAANIWFWEPTRFDLTPDEVA
ncbi:hypothetical protein PBRA_005650 [Plasmodiophora brassicae]|uniref:Fe2OG dioxygenase domain-containing protein n=1 Tax=Plasmodiophora brassicae TaxID=37360 RepID=A0A0G4IP70_PLABS|nr:hypothetical protein PBRA_005650 [Plasmodiophora brassicae]